MHLWLAPFTPGGKHSISITFAESIRIAMIRIWVRSHMLQDFVIKICCLVSLAVFS